MLNVLWLSLAAVLGFHSCDDGPPGGLKNPGFEEGA